MVFLETYNQI